MWAYMGPMCSHPVPILRTGSSIFVVVLAASQKRAGEDTSLGSRPRHAKMIKRQTAGHVIQFRVRHWWSLRVWRSFNGVVVMASDKSTNTIFMYLCSIVSKQVADMYNSCICKLICSACYDYIYLWGLLTTKCCFKLWVVFIVLHSESKLFNDIP